MARVRSIEGAHGRESIRQCFWTNLPSLDEFIERQAARGRQSNMTMSQIYDASHVASTPLIGAAGRQGDTIRPLRTSGELAPLFCVFPGPPGARQLADALPADLPVYEFAWPNLDGALHFPAVEELTSQYIDAVRRIQPAGPYPLCR